MKCFEINLVFSWIVMGKKGEIRDRENGQQRIVTVFDGGHLTVKLVMDSGGKEGVNMKYRNVQKCGSFIHLFSKKFE